MHLEAELRWLETCREQLGDMTAVLEARGLGARSRARRPCARCAASIWRSRRASSSTLMGPSGCGKSTLLHLLGGLDVPDAGELHAAGPARGHARRGGARASCAARTVGYVFQSLNLVASLTARENVELVARARRA